MNGTDAALTLDIEQKHPMRLAGSLCCEAGELLALVGPSGAGKTSMLRALAGLMRPARGRIAVQGEVWCDTSRGIFLPPQHRHVGFVFQNYALMPHLTALANVALSLLHVPRSERQEQAQHWLAHVGLSTDLHARLPSMLSGGQQQRVAVARALARKPKLLLLDEPFSAVDQMSRQSLYQLLADLRAQLSIPIVLVTHDLNEARLLADRFAVMDAGQILQQGSPAQIHRSPRNARVADLMGIHNRLHGQWLGSSEQQGWGRLQWHSEKSDASPARVLLVRDKGKLTSGQRVSWVISNDGIALLMPAPAQPSANEFQAKITEARYLGEITLVTLALTEIKDAKLQITLSGAQRQQVAVGMSVGVRLDMDLIHVMPVRYR